MSLNMGLLGSVALKPNQFIATGLGSGYGSAVTSIDGPSYIQSYGTTYKLSKNGRVLWAVQFPGTGNKQALAIDSNQNVYIAGNGSFVAALNSSGNVLWQREIGTGISWNSISFDRLGFGLGTDLYLTGTNGSYGHIVRLNQNTGAVVWGRRTSTVNVEFLSVSAEYGQLFAVGLTSNGTTFDTHAVNMDSDGTIRWQRRLSLGTSNHVFGGSCVIKVGAASLVSGFINSPRANFITNYNTSNGSTSFSLRASSDAGYIASEYGTVGYDASGASYLSFYNLYDNYQPYNKGTGYTRFSGSNPLKTVTFENLNGTLRLSTSSVDRTLGLMGVSGFIKVLGDDSVATGPQGIYNIIEDPQGFSYISSGITSSTDSLSYMDSGIVSTTSSFSPVASGVTSTVTYLR